MDDDTERKPAGIEISARAITRALVAVALVAAACCAAFLAGQTTRITDATADDRVRINVERVNAERDKELDAALADAKTLEQKRVKGLNKMWRGRVARIKRKHERQMRRQVESARDAGYASGSAAGYSSGHTDGEAEGFESGHEEGIEEASDELTCSDDKDVDLPPCFDW